MTLLITSMWWLRTTRLLTRPVFLPLLLLSTISLRTPRPFLNQNVIAEETSKSRHPSSDPSRQATLSKSRSVCCESFLPIGFTVTSFPHPVTTLKPRLFSTESSPATLMLCWKLTAIHINVSHRPDQGAPPYPCTELH